MGGIQAGIGMKVFLLLSLLVLSGCGILGHKPVPANEPMPVTVTKKQKIHCGPAPVIDPFSPRSTPPVVIEGHPKGTEIPDATWVGLTPQSYQNIADNLTDLYARIRQLKAGIDYYQRCIREYNAPDNQDAPVAPAQ